MPNESRHVLTLTGYRAFDFGRHASTADGLPDPLGAAYLSPLVGRCLPRWFTCGAHPSDDACALSAESGADSRRVAAAGEDALAAQQRAHTSTCYVRRSLAALPGQTHSPSRPTGSLARAPSSSHAAARFSRAHHRKAPIAPASASAWPK